MVAPTRRALFGGAVAVAAMAAPAITAALPRFPSELERRIDKALVDMRAINCMSGLSDDDLYALMKPGKDAVDEILALDGDDADTQRLRLKAMRWCHSDEPIEDGDFGECTNQRLVEKILRSALKAGAI